MSIGIDFVVTTDAAEQVVVRSFKKNHCKTLVYIDPGAPRVSSGYKYRIVDRIRDSLVSWRKRMANNVRDLVREGHSRSKELALVNDPRTECTITLKVFIEGQNWIPVERAIVFGYRKSIVELIQILGRLLREYKGKSHVQMDIILPFSFDKSDKEKFREELNKYLVYFFSTMVVQDLINPVKIKPNPGQKKNGSGGMSSSHPLVSVFGTNMNRWESFLSQVHRKLWDYATAIEGTVYEKNQECRKYLVQTLKQLSRKEYREILGNEKQLEDHIWRSLMRKSVQSKDPGRDLSHVNLDIIRDVFIVDCMQQYFSKIMDFGNLRELRKLIRNDEPFPITHPHLMAEWDWEKNASL